MDKKKVPTETKFNGSVNGVPVEMIAKTKPNNNGGYDTTVSVPRMSMTAKKEG